MMHTALYCAATHRTLHPRHRHLRPAARAALCLVVLLAAALAAVNAAAEEPVVPPGQDELLAAMFGYGTVLPGACEFVDGKANGPVIRTTYACPSGLVVFGLTHPSTAPDGAIQTARFAITLQSGAPPDELVGALVWLVRSREGAFQWGVVGQEGSVGADAAPEG